MVQVQTPTQTVDFEHLQAMTSKLLQAEGLTQEHAQLVAQSLVQANLRGIDSHGVARLPHYVAAQKIVT